MMSSKQKRKGDTAEREIVQYLNDNLINGDAKKIPASGALGTIVGESILTGDINIKIHGFPRRLKAECKAGYGNKLHPECKSLRVEKAWLDKIKEEASDDDRIPLFFGKFDGVRSGVKYFCAMDIETFVNLANYITELKERIDKYYDQQ